MHTAFAQEFADYLRGNTGLDVHMVASLQDWRVTTSLTKRPDIEGHFYKRTIEPASDKDNSLQTPNKNVQCKNLMFSDPEAFKAMWVRRFVYADGCYFYRPHGYFIPQ